MKYVSYIEVFEETLSVGDEEEERLQGPMKKFAAYMRKFRKVKAMVVNTQHNFNESDYPMVSGAFALFAKYFDGSAMRKLSLTLDFEEDLSYAFTNINWVSVVINFIVKMKNLKKLKIDTANMHYGYYYNRQKALRLRLLKRLKFLEKLEALTVKNGSGEMKKKEFVNACKKIPNVKHLNLDDFAEDGYWVGKDYENEENEDDEGGEDGGDNGGDDDHDDDDNDNDEDEDDDNHKIF